VAVGAVESSSPMCPSAGRARRSRRRRRAPRSRTCGAGGTGRACRGRLPRAPGTTRGCARCRAGRSRRARPERRAAYRAAAGAPRTRRAHALTAARAGAIASSSGTASGSDGTRTRDLRRDRPTVAAVGLALRERQGARSVLAPDSRKPVPKPVPNSTSVAYSEDAPTNEVLPMQALIQRSGAGVEPTHRRATPAHRF
jgi:hypothetical protein